MNHETVIKTEDLWFTYPNGVQALRDVNVEIKRREFIGIIGQNGSGKTTLAKHFNGLLKPTRGRVLVDGVDTRRVSVAELSRKVGYVFQNPDHQIFGRTILEEVSFGLKNVGVPKEKFEETVKEALRRVDLDLPLSHSPHLLSVGQKHRIAIASVLSMKPDVVILDEPTTGLDYRRCVETMEFASELNRDGCTIILITHDVALIADYTERVIVLKDGEVIGDGPTKRILSDSKLLMKTYLYPPQITELAQSLSHLGVPFDIIKVSEMVKYLTGRLN